MRSWTKLTLAAAVAGATPSALMAHGTALHETVTVAANEAIPNVPGKRLVSVVVDYPAGAQSLPHHHAKSAFIYAHVLAGEIRSQVNGGEVRTYGPGQIWFEEPGAHHQVSANASETKPARLLAVFILDEADVELTFPDSK